MIDLNRLLYNYQMPSDGGGGDGGDSDGGGDSGGDSSSDGGMGGSSGYGGYGGFAGGGSAAGISNNEENAGMGAGAGSYGGDSPGTEAAMSNNPAHLGMVEAGFHNNMYSGLNDAVAAGNFAGLSFSLDHYGTKTTFSFSKRSFSVTNKTGMLDGKLDSMTVRAYGPHTATVDLGFVATHLAELGLSPEEASIASTIGTAVVGALMGVSAISLGLTAVHGVANALGIAGTISQTEFDNISEAIAISSFTIGTLHTMQNIEATTSMFGYMNATQKALAITVSAISVANTVSQLQELSAKYGVNPSDINIADIADIEMNDSDGIATNYKKILEKQAIITEYGTKPDTNQIVDRMAGSVMFDMFMAGGLFEPSNNTNQLLASVGGEYDISNYSQMVLSQNDYLEKTTAYSQINRVYEPDVSVSSSIHV